VAQNGDRELDGLLAEFAFVTDGMRQNQRERQTYLAFTLAATGVLLGILLGDDSQQTSSAYFFVVALAGVVVVTAEVLTIRSTRGVTSHAAYIRYFIEERVPDLRLQNRMAEFPKRPVGTARGLGFVYLALAAALPFAWWELVPQRFQTCAGDIAIGVLTVGACVPALMLILRWPQEFWEKPDKDWKTIRDKEQDPAEGEPE
jgi:hypothetical protein